MTKYYDQNGKEISVDDIDFGKFELESRRFRQDCRKKALEFGYETSMKQISNSTAKMVIKEADIFYAWLIDILSPEV